LAVCKVASGDCGRDFGKIEDGYLVGGNSLLAAYGLLVRHRLNVGYRATLNRMNERIDK